MFKFAYGLLANIFFEVETQPGPDVLQDSWGSGFFEFFDIGDVIVL